MQFTTVNSEIRECSSSFLPSRSIVRSALNEMFACSEKLVISAFESVPGPTVHGCFAVCWWCQVQEGEYTVENKDIARCVVIKVFKLTICHVCFV